MEPTVAKPGFLRNVLVRLLLFGVFVVIIRFAYIITLAGETCNVGDFCFFSSPEKINVAVTGSGSGTGAGTGALSVRSSSELALPVHHASKDWINGVRFYSSVFQNMIVAGYLSPEAKSLCVDTVTGRDVFALKEIGVVDSVGISKKALKPLVKSGEGHRIPFGNNTFDFVFSGDGGLERTVKPFEFAIEIARTLKPEGVVKFNDIQGFDDSMPEIREIVVKKIGYRNIDSDINLIENKKCNLAGYKRELVKNAEELIEEEPLKPWITLKKNVKNIKYASSMVDISFKSRYVYVDVGARSYGSSIGSWFKKQYPKQNKTFHVYAIEADKAFHQEYAMKKGVTLLPYAAWVKNESLVFEINNDPGDKKKEKVGRGMGRIQPLDSQGGGGGGVQKIQGFDFAEWLKNTVTMNDFVVMKMDVEGTEFDLIPRLFETGAICLVDEIFLECHYNRWQRCCPGQRSPKYEKTYDQCLQLFNSLRQSGVLVHQWF
ncbi:hypothetical protein TSUD_262120 [Trifolium subterraneum]|nr:hypothetical protein TSUD_262120 [Trifolium subterraneum]